MDTPDIEWEKEVHTFVNELAMQLTPSNDTMNAVRLIRKDLPDFISYMRTSHTTYWKEQLQKTREEERERIIYITKNIKDAFMSPLTERRWLQCIQFTDQPISSTDT